MSGRDASAALEALSLAYGGLVAVMERFGETDSDQERRRLLIAMVNQAWLVRDGAADVYAALVNPIDADGTEWGSLG
jgi:hypothetical protein